MSEPVPFAEANKPEPGSDTLPRDNTEVGSAATLVRKKDVPASVDLNALHRFSPEELAALARQFDVFLYPARSRHYKILDFLGGALSSGSTVTAEGFIDPVGD